MRRVAPLALIAAAALAGCRVGPHYHAPATPASAAPAFIETDARFANTAPTDPRWWRLFNDPVLDRLIADAFAHNTDLRVAYANVARARGALREVRGQRFPSTTASGSYSRIGQSSAFGGSRPAGVGAAAPFSVFDLGYGFNYELDLFGRVYRQIQAARRDLEAERALADQMRVTVAAETARAYVGLCAGAEQERVATRTIALLDRSLAITQLTLDAGRGTRLDVERARTLREQQAADLAPIVAARAAARYSLAQLTGRAPADLGADALACATTPRIRAPFPVGDGRALLARRPDIRAAERALAADTARIGVATADLYPTVTLGASASLSAGAVRKLFTTSAIGYTLGPSISFAFPNQEGPRGRILQARAQAAASLARFDGTVLAALRDTETAMSGLGRELDRHQSLTRARDSARVSAELSRLRFSEGLDSFLTQLDADRTLAQTQAALAQSEQAIAEDQVDLFRALGGGWEDSGDPRGDAKPVFDGSKRGPAQPG